MGWNDWNAYGCNVSETLVEQTADKIVSAGLAGSLLGDARRPGGHRSADRLQHLRVGRELALDLGRQRRQPVAHDRRHPGQLRQPGHGVVMYRVSGGTTGGTTTKTIRGSASNRCLDDPNGTTTNGTQVVIWDCNGQANQPWNVNSDGSITGVQSGLCLDVAGAATANNTAVQLWTCNAASNQKWS